MEKFTKINSMLKVIEDNFKILHHNIVGENWFSVHEKLAEYYEKVGDVEDAIIEMGIMNGCADVSIKDAVLNYDSLEVKPYDVNTAFSLSLKMFNDIVNELNIVKEGLPADCVSEIETYQYWFRLESKYKLVHKLAA